MKVLIFGGTKEGRELTLAHMRSGDDVLCCVTSEYARALLPGGARCLAQALNAQEMRRLMRSEAPDLVVDATHPFAALATKNIRLAAIGLGIPLERIQRPKSRAQDWTGDVEWAPDANAAARALTRTAGNILLTTGVNTLWVYAQALDKGRLYARVLPCARSLLACEELEMPPGHVIAMQGPFTRALNAALYDMLDIRVMVSKDSGAAGGVEEKVLPALAREIHVIMIERPGEESVCAEKV